jgi:CRISPR type IV-associated protein Csf2
MFEQVCYAMILRAVTPIAHHSESFGNTAIVMTEPVLQPDGSVVDVPIITGDTMRHGLRSASAYSLLDAAGLLDDPSLSEAATRLLFAGGQIGGSSGSTVSLSEYRQMVELVPSLGLLGGCAGNRMYPGRLEVDRALLICREAWTLLEHDAWATSWISRTGYVVGSVQSHVAEVKRVRMDPTLDPVKRALMSAQANTSTEQRMLASEAASESGDAVAIRDSKSSMMPRSFEVVAAGSHYTWSVSAKLTSELDRDTLHLMLGAWLTRMVVGGKKGTGHGKLQAVPGSASCLHLTQPAAPEAFTLPSGSMVGELFRSHVHARRDRIKDFLAKVEA